MPGHPCCCVKDPCDFIGDPPASLQATELTGGSGVFTGGPHLLPNKGTSSELSAAILGGRTLSSCCYYYWSDDLGSSEYFVVGVNCAGGGNQQNLWALDTSIGGPITNTLVHIWGVNPLIVLTDWAYFDTTRQYVYGNIFGTIVGTADVEAAP
jgi:hypothetical protein